MTIRKHYATLKDPHNEVSSRCCWQSVQTDRKTKTDEHCLCKLVGSSSRKLWSVYWSVLFCVLFLPFVDRRFVLVPSRNNFHCPSCFHLDLQHIHTHKPLNPWGCTPSPSSSVHFLSAGQHCLLEEREHKEDPRPLSPFALGEVIRHDIISLLHGGWKHIFSRWQRHKEGEGNHP